MKKTPISGSFVGGMRFSSATQISMAQPATWVPIVFRLTNGAPEAVSCDFVYSATVSNSVNDVRRLPTAMRLEASNDGVHWQQVWERDNLEIPTGAVNEYRWISNGDLWKTSNQVRKSSSGAGFAFDSLARQQRETSVLAAVPSLSVAAGSSFRVESDASVPAPTVSSVSVDAMTGAGSVSGVEFAGQGTLDVRNMPYDLHSSSVPLGFAGAVGAENLRNWTFTINGESSKFHNVTVSQDGSRLVVSRKGTVLMIR